MAYDLSDYVDVAERICIFRDKHAEGSLQSVILRYPEEGFPWVVVEARAYRHPSDERPGVGLAWEPFPGKTPFTKDSELMVCETSAWGRAIVAVLAADTKRGVASRDEVAARTRQEEVPESNPPAPPTGSGDLLSRLLDLARTENVSRAQLTKRAHDAWKVTRLEDCSEDRLHMLANEIGVAL